MKYFGFSRGGFNTKENGTYCCIEINNKIIGCSSIESGLSHDTELSAISNAIENLKLILLELNQEKCRIESKKE